MCVSPPAFNGSQPMKRFRDTNDGSTAPLSLPRRALLKACANLGVGLSLAGTAIGAATLGAARAAENLSPDDRAHLERYKKNYPDLNFYDLDGFLKARETHLVVDVRTGPEYRAMHLDGAIHLHQERSYFLSRLRQIRNDPAYKNKEVIFYCNGYSCVKSSLAGQRAVLDGHDGCHVYAGGRAEIERYHPELLVDISGRNVDPKKIPSRDEIKRKHFLDPASFMKKYRESKNASLWDVRDPSIALLQPAIQDSYFVETDDLDPLNEEITKDKDLGREIFVYDSIGIAGYGLYFDFTRAGVKSFWFMDGGARAMST